MVFSSPIFLFGFLPLALILYFLSPRIVKNYSLLACSLIFYAWGEVFYLALMLVSIISNYFVGLLIHKSQTSSHYSNLPKIWITTGIVINISLLGVFKYANFICDNINAVLSIVNIPTIDLEPVHLPLGISFFTFQAISYIVDVYKKEVPAQKNIFNLALYISLFPQLIAGPIVRYHDIASQIIKRTHSIDKFASGVRRFIMGLAKKMLIANSVGVIADSVFELGGDELTLPLAWIGIIAYSLQIFFDFSGYSDMAIGLGKMFGFHFLENFNYPYISTSLREFWRRWHISLSTWFRDYVYIALGGSRRSPVRVYINLLIVFILTGIWHGASWNFLIWGLFHGLFLATEHAGFSKVLKKVWRPITHLYLLLVVVVGWVIFRSDTIPQALSYMKSMVSVSNLHTSTYRYSLVLSYETLSALIIGIIICTPIFPKLKSHLEKTFENNTMKMFLFVYFPQTAILVALLIISSSKIAASTYNPFLYFRF